MHHSLTRLWLAALGSAAIGFTTTLHADTGPATATTPALTTKSEAVMKQPSWQLGDPITMANGKLTWDAEIRERYEYRYNWVDFNSAVRTNEEQGLLQRLRLGLKWTPAEWLTAYAQLQDSRTFFYEPTSNATRTFTNINDPINLHQGYLQFNNLGGENLMFRAGRQVLSYGDQRLVGAFEWDNNARVFDAVRASFKGEGFTLDAFAGYVVMPHTNDWDNPDTTDLFTGLYAQTDPTAWLKADFFAFWRSKSDVIPNTSNTGDDDRTSGNPAPAGDYITLGSYMSTKPNTLGPWDGNTSFAFQAGGISNPTGMTLPPPPGITINNGRQDLLAGAFHGEVGYTLEPTWKPRLFGEFNFGSGTGSPNSSTSNTFQNLYPTNHYYYGYMDRFAWMNMINPGIGFTCEPIEKLKVSLEYNMFWLAETNDPWRNAGQQAVGGAPRYYNALTRDPSSFVGSELDLMAKYPLTKWLKLEGGYSHFFAGDYIGETSPAGSQDDADFAYVQVQANF